MRVSTRRGLIKLEKTCILTLTGKDCKKMNDFVVNEVRDAVIATLLKDPENKESKLEELSLLNLLLTCTYHLPRYVSTAKARTQSGAARTSVCSSATSARASIAPWVSTSPLSGKYKKDKPRQKDLHPSHTLFDFHRSLKMDRWKRKELK